MERQLIKVAKELNVGMGTVVEFLSGKGFEIENRPISKVTDAMYDALSKKFSDSKADKEKADQIAFGVRPMQQQQQQQPAPQSRPTTPISIAPPAERRPISIGSLTAKPTTEEKPVVAVEKPALPDVIERPKIVLPKIVGRIDLTPKKEEPKPQQKVDVKPAQPQQPRDGQAPRDGQRNNDQRRDGQAPRDGQRNNDQRRDGQAPRDGQRNNDQRRD